MLLSHIKQASEMALRLRVACADFAHRWSLKLLLLVHRHKWRPVRFHNGQYLRKCDRCGAWK